MAERRYKPAHLVRTGIWFGVPVAAVLAAAWAFGAIGIGPALAAAAAILLLQWLLLVPALRALDAALETVRALGREGAAPPRAERAARRFAPAEDIASAAARVRRGQAAPASQGGDHGLSGLLQAIPEPLIILSAGRQILRVNDAARRLFDTAPEGRDVAVVLRNPALVDAVDDALARKAPSEVEFRLRHPTERDYLAFIRPLALPAPDPALLIMLQDLTAVRRIDELRSDFVANVSHELRTPLSSLIGFIETLQGPASEDPGARARFLEIMGEQANRMAALVADLTSLSRIELEEHSRPTGAVEIVPLLQRLMEALQPPAAGRDIRFRLATPEDEDAGAIRVTGDEHQLYQVFENLLSNAIKYASRETTVTLTVARHDDAPVRLPAAGRGGGSALTALPAPAAGPAVSIAVRDRGEGIPREHLARLTERFYRVDTARSRALGGTGLGLAIVKHILARHRARLDIESIEGEGSTFTVWLPAAGGP